MHRAKHETDRKAEHHEQSLCGYELEAVVARMAACCKEKTVCTFCIDGSGSVTPGDFRVMTTFVATAMERLTQSHPLCKVGRLPIVCAHRVSGYPAYLRDEFKHYRSDFAAPAWCI